MAKDKNSRDALRAATIGAAHEFRQKVVDLGDGIQVLVRQPSVGARSDVRKRCTTISANGTADFDIFDFLIWSVITCTYTVDTKERVYSDEDYAALRECPTGGFLDDLGAVASEMMNVDAKATKKHLKPTSKTS